MSEAVWILARMICWKTYLFGAGKHKYPNENIICTLTYTAIHIVYTHLQSTVRTDSNSLLYLFLGNKSVELFELLKLVT